jgi:hypothetical protein
MDYYSSVDDVLSATGVKPTDLGIESDSKLREFIEARLSEIKSLIDTYCGRDFSSEGKVPAGINMVAAAMASDFLALAMLRRSTPIVTVNDFTVKQVQSDIFTMATMKALDIYIKKPHLTITVIGGNSETEEIEEIE